MLLTAMMAISLAATLAARGPTVARPVDASPAVSPLTLGTPPTTGRVVLLAFDGATLDLISPAVAEGRLPNLGRVFDGGAVLHLATLRPTQAETPPIEMLACTARSIRASEYDFGAIL